MKRAILHCDMNNFYASVELLDRPDLQGRPVAVCGDPASRHGIILAKNQAAKRYGIVTASTVWQARRQCPDLVLLSAHHDKYRAYYKIINQIYGRYTDKVEPFSIDESWLDVTASRSLFGTGRQIADQIRATVRKETGLTLSAGVSFNKFFAKMGSDYKKPDATTEITAENFRDLLWPLDVARMFMVGRVTASRLRQCGIRTIGDLAGADPDFLTGLLGRAGADLHDFANGIDDRPVALQNERRKVQSVGHGMTFTKDLATEDEIRTAALALSDKACARLRKNRMKARGLKVDIKDPAFQVFSRQTRLPRATDNREDIYRTAIRLIDEVLHQKNRSGRRWRQGAPIRLLTVTCIGLTDADEEEQLSLFGEENEKVRAKESHINEAMDHIRSRFGSGAITYARVIGNDIGLDEKTYADSHDKDEDNDLP
ncbi:MAG: DNA polymerase IV [Eubacteriales bacterium]|nr:DNA polymerase IV [Eubacteriales bacterium]